MKGLRYPFLCNHWSGFPGTIGGVGLQMEQAFFVILILKFGKSVSTILVCYSPEFLNTVYCRWPPILFTSIECASFRIALTNTSGQQKAGLTNAAKRPLLRTGRSLTSVRSMEFIIHCHSTQVVSACWLELI